MHVYCAAAGRSGLSRNLHMPPLTLAHWSTIEEVSRSDSAVRSNAGPGASWEDSHTTSPVTNSYIYFMQCRAVRSVVVMCV